MDPTPLDVDALSPAEIAALKESERAGRDAGAPRYLDAIRSRGAFRLRAEDLVVLRCIAPRSRDRVLDAGCGVGRHALRVAPRAAHVTGVDFSAEALRVLAEEAARRGITNVDVSTADVCALPASLGRFDVVYSSEVLQHVPSHAERLAAMRGFHARLEPGGRCIVNVLCWNARVRGAKDGFWAGGSFCHYTTPGELRALFEEAGFRGVGLHGLLVAPGSLTRHLPPSFALLEAGLSAVPFLAGAGRFVVGVGRA